VGARVPFQVKSVVEPFATEGAEVALDVTVTLHVTVQESLEAEGLGAEVAGKAGAVPQRLRVLGLLPLGPRHAVRHLLVGQRVLDTVSSVDELQRDVSRQAKPSLDDAHAHLEGGDGRDVTRGRRGERARPVQRTAGGGG